MFGEVGAIIGGTSEKKSTAVETNYCFDLKLKITINNLKNPCEFINIIDRQTNRETTKYKQSYEQAQKILSIIEIICQNNKKQLK